MSVNAINNAATAADTTSTTNSTNPLLDSTSTFIRSAGGGYRGMSNGFRLGSLLSPMEPFIAQFKAGKIQNYFDVIQASH